MIWPAARRASKFLQWVENIIILTYRAGSSQLPADVTLKRFQIPSLHQRINGIGQCRAPGFDIFLIISIRDSEEPSIIYLTLLTKSKLIIFWRFEYFVNVKYYREIFVYRLYRGTWKLPPNFFFVHHTFAHFFTSKPSLYLSNTVLPLVVFRFLMSLLIEGRANMCVKSWLLAFSIGKQWEAHRSWWYQW